MTKKKPTTADERRNAADLLKRRAQQSAENALRKLEEAKKKAEK